MRCNQVWTSIWGCRFPDPVTIAEIHGALTGSPNSCPWLLTQRARIVYWLSRSLERSGSVADRAALRCGRKRAHKSVGTALGPVEMGSPFVMLRNACTRRASLCYFPFVGCTTASVIASDHGAPAWRVSSSFFRVLRGQGPTWAGGQKRRRWWLRALSSIARNAALLIIS